MAPSTSTPNANVAWLLAAAGGDEPQRPAILQYDGTVLWTFGDLIVAASRTARLLRRAGLGQGDRVLIAVPSRRGAYAAVAGAMWAGAAALMPSRGATLRGVGSLQPRGLVIGSGNRLTVLTTSGRMRTTRLAGADAPRLTRAPGGQPAELSPSSPAILSFTTGSTGRPKAVIRTHGNLLAQHRALTRLRPPVPGDVDLAGTPLLVLHNLVLGVTSLLPPPPRLAAMPGFQPSAVLRGGVTTIAGFPSLFEQLIAGPAVLLPAVRAAHIGGDAVRPNLLRRLASVMPGAQVTIVYGATEAEPMSAIGADEYLMRLAGAPIDAGICLGQPVPETEVRIDSNGADVGRILVRGQHVVAGPRDDGGWHDTGDIGRADSAGRLWWKGRAAHAIGPGLFAEEVERAVEDEPGVARAAVGRRTVGSEDRAMLLIEVGDGGIQADVTRRLRDLVARRRWPVSETVFVDRIPRDGRTGSKVDRRAVARLVNRRRV
jgi:acyl-CoA synthetase (AMP-forming)/AMP-acid ligase II